MQASSSSSENGVMSNDPVRLVIKVGTDDSMPEPPSIFYAEQKRVKQKLSSLKAEKQQLQRQLSTLQETKEEYSAELQQCPELLAQARSRVSLLEQQQTGITAALHQSQQAESQLRKQLQESLSSCDALRSSLAESQQTCDKATFEAATLTTQLEAATADSDSLTQQLTSQQQAAEPLQQQCSNLQAELQNSQDRVTALQQELLHFQPAEIKEQHPASDGLLIKHQLQRVQTDRDALQLQVGTLQEALAKAQRFSTPPSPSGLTPPSVSQTPSPIRDEVALRGIKAIRAVLGQVADMQQSAEAEGSPAVLEEAVQGLEGAQAHAQELEDQIMAWQARLLPAVLVLAACRSLPYAYVVSLLVGRQTTNFWFLYGFGPSAKSIKHDLALQGQHACAAAAHMIH